MNGPTPFYGSLRERSGDGLSALEEATASSGVKDSICEVYGRGSKELAARTEVDAWDVVFMGTQVGYM